MKIEINLKILLLGILFFILKQFDIYVIFIIFIILHELAHLLVGILFGLRPKMISINPLGVSMQFFLYKDKREWKKIVTYLAGPILNLIFGIIFIFITLNENLKIKIVYTNFLLTIFNLIPMMPLDGGKILKVILVKKIGNKEASIFMNNLTQTILVVITLLYSIAILRLKNFAIFLLIVYLWYLKYLEDKKLKTMILAYDIIEKKVVQVK